MNRVCILCVSLVLVLACLVMGCSRYGGSTSAVLIGVFVDALSLGYRSLAKGEVSAVEVTGPEMQDGGDLPCFSRPEEVKLGYTYAIRTSSWLQPAGWPGPE